jgi:septal ring factor EnvC (AmiA/AmiB activator)
MSKQPTRSLDGFLATLEKRAHVARTISIVITVSTIALAAVTLIFTIREVKERINQEKATLAGVTKERIDAETQRELAKKELEVIQSKLDQLKRAVAPFTNDNPVLAEKVSEAIGANISIAIQHESQRAKANEVARELRAKGYIVYKITLRRPGPTEMQVRFFRRDDPGESEEIASILRAMGFSQAQAHWVEGFENSPTWREYQIFFGSS